MENEQNVEIVSDRAKGPELSSSQQRLWDCLRSLRMDKLPFDQWYLGALYALENPMNPERFSQAAQTMRELLEKLPKAVKQLVLVEESKVDFTQLRSTLIRKYDQAKSGYPDGWLGKQIDVPLDSSLQSLDEYIKASNKGKPSRSQKVIELVYHSAKKDPLYKPNEQLIVEQRKIRIEAIWKFFEKVAHHGSVSDAEFEMYLRNCENELLSIFETSPSVDLNRLTKIIRDDITAQSADECMRLLLKSGANRLFFFQKAENPEWIDHLIKNDLFSGIEDVEEIEGNQIRANYWMPANYLRKAAKIDPQKVVHLIQNLRTTNNPRILEEFCQIANELPELEDSIALKHRVFAYCKTPSHWFNIEALSNIFIKWCSAEPFRKDAFRILKERPFSEDSWDYQEFFKIGIKKAIEICPIDVFSSLINLLSSILDSNNETDGNREHPQFDFSEHWCPSLLVEEEYEHSSKAIIARLAYKVGLELCTIDHQNQLMVTEQLRSSKWQIFDRIRWCIQTAHIHDWDPKEISKELSFNKPAYSKNEYIPEFAILLKCSIAAHGESLFFDNDLRVIIDAILVGPNKENYANWLGDSFTEEKYTLHKRYVHRQKLAPFEPILDAEIQNYFAELIADPVLGPFKDTEEAPKRSMAGFVTTRSPMTKDEILALNDHELLELLNSWESEYHDPNNWLVEYTISGLSNEFKELLIEHIFTDESRWAFWKTNISTIQRPIYVESLIEAGKEFSANGNHSLLADFLDICDLGLTHKDAQVPFELSGSSHSRSKPNWNGVRRCILSFIESLVKDDSICSLSHRPRIIGILSTLCSDFDSGLDVESKHLSHDVLTTAFNRTRSRAISCVVQSCFWMRKNVPDDPLVDLFGILDNRLQSELEMTQPEFAILGREIHRLWNLNKEWVRNSIDWIFPIQSFDAWCASFGTYLRYFSSNGVMFSLLQDSYQFATHNVVRLAELNSGKDLVKKLGQHLVRQFIIGAFPHTGSDLLSQYYIQFKQQPEIHSELFEHVGWGLGNSKLDESIEARIKEFFRWNIDGDNFGCVDFSQWLNADCLELTWRLEAFKEVLAKNPSMPKGIHRDLEFLRKHMENNELITLECLELIAKNAIADKRFHFDEDDVKFIIESGVQSSNDHVKSIANRTLDIFLSKGFIGLSGIKVSERS